MGRAVCLGGDECRANGCPGRRQSPDHRHQTDILCRNCSEGRDCFSGRSVCHCGGLDGGQTRGRCWAAHSLGLGFGRRRAAHHRCSGWLGRVIGAAGGVKGISSDLLVEVLCAALADGRLGPDQGSFTDNDGQPIDNGQFFIAIDPERFPAADLTPPFGGWWRRSRSKKAAAAQTAARGEKAAACGRRAAD